MENYTNDFIFNHLGEERSSYLNSGSPPLFMTSLFSFSTLEEMRKALQNESTEPFYTRGTNPTLTMLSEKLAALEDGEECLLFASGSAAVSAAMLAQLRGGDHVVCVEKPYSWTAKLLNNFLSRFGVTVTYIDGSLDSLKKAIRKETKVLYLETPNSFTFEIQDIALLSDYAHEFGLVVMVDNSYSTPLFQKPLALGADMVIHSASKYFSGHSDVIGGALICSKKHKEMIFAGEYMTMGGTMSPLNAWLILRGLRTLDIRLKKSDETGRKMAGFLAVHPAIEKVYYPFHPSHPQYEIAIKQMKGAGGLLSFKLKSEDPAKIEAFCDALKYFLLACSWGSYESLCFPAAALVSSANYHSSPFPPNLFRIYCGLEDADLLIADIKNALFSSGL